MHRSVEGEFYESINVVYQVIHYIKCIVTRSLCIISDSELKLRSVSSEVILAVSVKLSYAADIVGDYVNANGLSGKEVYGHVRPIPGSVGLFI